MTRLLKFRSKIHLTLPVGLLFFYLAAIGALSPSYAAEADSPVQQSATAWEHCIDSVLQQTSNTGIKAETLRQAKARCQNHKDATLAQIPADQRDRVSAAMDAAFDKHVQ